MVLEYRTFKWAETGLLFSNKYSHWYKISPSFAHESQQCGVLMGHGFLVDIPCQHSDWEPAGSTYPICKLGRSLSKLSFTFFQHEYCQVCPVPMLRLLPLRTANVMKLCAVTMSTASWTLIITVPVLKNAIGSLPFHPTPVVVGLISATPAKLVTYELPHAGMYPNVKSSLSLLAE